MSARPRIAAGQVVQAVLMEAAAVGAGVALWYTTGEIGWLFIGIVGGAAALFFVLVRPLLAAARAARDGKGDRLVE